MINLVLDPGMLQIPENPSSTEAENFVDRIIKWNKACSKERSYPFLSAKNKDQAQMGLYSSQDNLNPNSLMELSKALPHLEWHDLTQIIPPFIAALTDPLDEQDIVVTTKNEADAWDGPSEMNTRLTAEGFKGLIEEIVYCEVCQGGVHWGVISDIESGNIGGAITGTVQQGTGVINASEKRFSSPIFNTPDQYQQAKPATRNLALSGKTVAIYTLHERDGVQPKSTIQEIYLGVRVEITYGNRVTNRIEDLANNADIFGVFWRSAAHSVTPKIKRLRVNRGRKLNLDHSKDTLLVSGLPALLAGIRQFVNGSTT